MDNLFSNQNLNNQGFHEVDGDMKFGNYETASKKFDHFTEYDAALGCVTFVALNFIFIMVYSMLPLNLRTALYYPASFLIEAIFGIAAWFVAKTQKVDIVKATNLNKKISPKIVLYSFLIAAASLIFFADLTYIYSGFLELLGYESQNPGLSIPNFGTYLLYIVISCLSPAFFEELLFRGVILSGFSKRTEKFAILFSAFIFTIMHGSADQTVHQFIVGILIGYIFYETRNYWIGFFVHFFNNFISVTITFLFTILGKTPEVASAVETSVESSSSSGFKDILVDESPKLFSYVISIVFAVVLVSVGYYVVMYLIKKVSEENEKVNGKVTTKSATTSQNNVNNNYENLQSQNNNEFEVNPSDYEIKSEDYVVMETQEQSQSNGTQNAETQTDNNQIADGSENVNKIVEKGVEDNKRFATTLMLAISIGYLVVEWILSLLSGF